MSEAVSPGGVPGVGTGGISGKVALGLVLRSLAELQETQGVTPHRVYRHIASKGTTRMTPGRLQLAMEKAVKDGILVQQRGRYNLNLELPVPDLAWGGGGCGCGSGKPAKSRSSSSKRCAKKKRSRRRSRSSKRRCRRRRKPLCGQVSLYKRLMRLLFPRKRCSKRKKRQPFTWVRQHCRRNPHHSRYKKRGRR